MQFFMYILLYISAMWAKKLILLSGNDISKFKSKKRKDTSTFSKLKKLEKKIITLKTEIYEFKIMHPGSLCLVKHQLIITNFFLKK